eukprot:gene5944-6183_t
MVKCAIITPDSKIAVGILSVILVILFSFSGYLVRNVPVYFSWISRISYFSFATDILTANEFTGLQFFDPSTGSSVPANWYSTKVHAGLQAEVVVPALAPIALEEL